MLNEKTMRTLSNCKQMAERLNEAFNKTLEDIRVAELNVRIKVNNLQQSNEDRAVLTELDKYLLSSVYEPLTQCSDVMEKFICSFEEAQAAADESNLSSSLKTLLGVAQRLISDVKLVKTQARRLNVSFGIQNAYVNEQMSNDMERIDNIPKSLDAVFNMIRETVEAVESVLKNI